MFPSNVLLPSGRIDVLSIFSLSVFQNAISRTFFFPFDVSLSLLSLVFQLAMTTYTIEEIRRLNGCLLEIQREHLCNTTTTAVISDTSLTPQQAWEDNDKTQFLLAANQALDGLLSKTDQLADINKYLTWYASFQQDSDYQLNDSVLDWLFVTKCTLAVYGCSLSSILQSTLPLSESLAYWDSIYGNPWYEAYYGLQSKCFPPQHMDLD